ncbi:MAG: type III pantothenate kinase [Roseivirga sp.]|nr:type III pantothenate kinase [Roseivirga sp.]
MKLALDIGNTFTKYGFFEENTLVEQGVVYGLDELDEFLTSRSRDFDKSIVCSVGYKHEELEPFFSADKEVLYLSHITRIPIGVAYATPRTLGMDRLAAVIGATELFSESAVMVIDIGTCITYDYLNQAGVFEGGIISPGVELRYKAMHQYTQRLPLLNDREAKELIGNSTAGAMRSGVINGITGEIEYMISQFLLKTPDLKVIITGGGAKTFESRIKADIFVALEIVLVGLNRVLDYNA